MRKAPAETETVAERDARFWDNFYSVKQSLHEFESDAELFYQLRANRGFQRAHQGKDIKVLRPTLQSACPQRSPTSFHARWSRWATHCRGCDQSESIGANVKSTIRRRVARNNIDGKARKHSGMAQAAQCRRRGSRRRSEVASFRRSAPIRPGA